MKKKMATRNRIRKESCGCFAVTARCQCAHSFAFIIRFGAHIISDETSDRGKLLHFIELLALAIAAQTHFEIRIISHFC